MRRERFNLKIIVVGVVVAVAVVVVVVVVAAARFAAPVWSAVGQ